MKLIPGVDCKSLADLVPGELAARCSHRNGLLIAIEKLDDNPDHRFLSLWRNQQGRKSVAVIDIRPRDAKNTSCLTVGKEWTINVPINRWERMPESGWHEGALILGSGGLCALAVHERLEEARFVSLAQFDTGDFPEGVCFWTKEWEIGLIHDADDQFQSLWKLTAED